MRKHFLMTNFGQYHKLEVQDYGLFQKVQFCLKTLQNNDRYARMLPRADRTELPYEIYFLKTLSVPNHFQRSGRSMMGWWCFLKNVFPQKRSQGVWDHSRSIPDQFCNNLEPLWTTNVETQILRKLLKIPCTMLASCGPYAVVVEFVSSDQSSVTSHSSSPVICHQGPVALAHQPSTTHRPPRGLLHHPIRQSE